MRKLVLAVATLAMFSMTAFAGESAQDVRALGAKLWKTAKRTSSVKSQKDDLTIVYGGEDVSHRLSAADSFIA